jgi:hypothetical protein
MCTVLLPPGVNPAAVNKYIISYHIVSYLTKLMLKETVQSAIFLASLPTSLLPWLVKCSSFTGPESSFTALPVVRVLSQINPFHTLPLYSCKFYFNIIFPTMHKSSNSPLSFGFSNRKYQLMETQRKLADIGHSDGHTH